MNITDLDVSKYRGGVAVGVTGRRETTMSWSPSLAYLSPFQYLYVCVGFMLFSQRPAFPVVRNRLQAATSHHFRSRTPEANPFSSSTSESPREPSLGQNWRHSHPSAIPVSKEMASCDWPGLGHLTSLCGKGGKVCDWLTATPESPDWRGSDGAGDDGRQQPTLTTSSKKFFFPFFFKFLLKLSHWLHSCDQNALIRYGHKRRTEENFEMIQLFCILTQSVPISWSWYCPSFAGCCYWRKLSRRYRISLYFLLQLNVYLK